MSRQPALDRCMGMTVPTETFPAFSGAQLRAARALLGWTTQKLAAEAGVSVACIRRAEFGAGSQQTIPAVARGIVTALAASGVEFTAAEGRGLGVAFKYPEAPAKSAPRAAAPVMTRLAS
jgi:transcriptional regulator with XRE-family HTH domain